eukprot:scaffold654139_cov25-Prasinocladus_malaysianus.AAC.1
MDHFDPDCVAVRLGCIQMRVDWHRRETKEAHTCGDVTSSTGLLFLRRLNVVEGALAGRLSGTNTSRRPSPIKYISSDRSSTCHPTLPVSF